MSIEALYKYLERDRLVSDLLTNGLWRRFVYSYTSAGQEPAEEVQLDRDQLNCTRQVLN
jgi:hypothetical protein